MASELYTYRCLVCPSHPVFAGWPAAEQHARGFHRNLILDGYRADDVVEMVVHGVQLSILDEPEAA